MKNWVQKVREEEKKKGGTVKHCPFRTNYHIMPPVGWLNDPNGLCQFKGIYQTYFQYAPFSVNGGDGFWGHCTSTDLLHWEYHDPVMAPDIPEDRSGVYSGSGLVEGEELTLFYTGNVKLPGDYDYIDAGRISSQMMATTKDGQHMSEKRKLLGPEDYPEHMTEHVRDPKVWKEDGKYRMILGARARAYRKDGTRKDKGCALVYVSEDKQHWDLDQEILPENNFGYMWECPDLFVMEDADEDKKIEILSFCPQGLPTEEGRFQNRYQSGYVLMSQMETIEDDFVEWDMGFDFYAPQTFEDDKGRRILIGWAGVPDTGEEHRNLSVENGWQHCLTIPRELTLQNGKILQEPVHEVESLPWKVENWNGERFFWGKKTVRLTVDNISPEGWKLCVGGPENGATFSVKEKHAELSFLMETGEAAACGGGRKKRTGILEMDVENVEILIDSSIMEIFINGGAMVFTTRIYLKENERELWASKAGKQTLCVL